jgi:hypothetical protein
MGSAAGISRPDEHAVVEIASIENISDHGARIVAPGHWKSGDRLVIYTQGSFNRSITARVVFCEPLPDGHFAIGCKFDEGISIQSPPRKT